ncbi:MAG TPA: type II toxin-antitoxin system RelE/ParE family toxin [Candidatus Kapabacteria bacterium]
MVYVRWSRRALDRIRQIHNYIALDAPDTARKYAETLIRSTDRLVMLPLSGRIVPEFEQENIREIIKGNYRIVYKVLSDTEVIILTVFHSSQLLHISDI